GQPDRLDVEDGRSVGVRAHLPRVRRDEQQVGEPQRLGAEQLRQQAGQVAVPAAVVDHRLDAHLRPDAQRRGEPTHPARGPRAVGYVDAVDPRFLPQPEAVQHAAGVDAAWGYDLDGREELTGSQLAPPA